MDNRRRIVAVIPVDTAGGRAAGSSGADVCIDLSPDEIREVQHVLIRRGFSVEADGVLGPRTRQALIQFQQPRTACRQPDASTAEPSQSSACRSGRASSLRPQALAPPARAARASHRRRPVRARLEQQRSAMDSRAVSLVPRNRAAKQRPDQQSVSDHRSGQRRQSVRNARLKQRARVTAGAPARAGSSEQRYVPVAAVSSGSNQNIARAEQLVESKLAPLRRSLFCSRVLPKAFLMRRKVQRSATTPPERVPSARYRLPGMGP